MIMSAGLRKLALTAHVTASIGWFGAIAAFLALAIVGMTSDALQLVRAAYPAMQLMTWFVIVPLAAVSFLSGIVSSLGTRWGLFRHYWVLLKLLLTSFSIVILMVHTQPIDFLAVAAAKTGMFGVDLHAQQALLVYASAVALAVLLVLTVLSIY